MGNFEASDLILTIPFNVFYVPHDCLNFIVIHEYYSIILFYFEASITLKSSYPLKINSIL